MKKNRIIGYIAVAIAIMGSCSKSTEESDYYLNGWNLDTGCNSDSSHYYYTINDQRQYLVINSRCISISFTGDVTDNTLDEITSQYFEIDSITFFQNNSLAHAYLKGGISCLGIQSLIRELNKQKKVLCANPTFYLSETLITDRPLDDRYDLITLTNEFVVKLKAGISYSDLTALMQQTGVKQVSENSGIILLSADKFARYNSLEMSKYYYETGKFEFSHPDFIMNMVLD